MKKYLLIPVLALSMLSCAKPYVAHPGSVNTFDSQSYDFLIATKAIIDQTKTDLANNVFSATTAPRVKAAVNGMVAAYNIADNAYLVYHTAMIAGGATAQQIQDVSNSQADVQKATQALTSAKAGS